MKNGLHIRVTVDTNDADYVESVHPVTFAQVEELQPLLDAIKANHGTYPRGDQGEAIDVYPEHAGLVDLFENFCPYPEYGFHSVKRVEVFFVSDYQRVL